MAHPVAVVRSAFGAKSKVLVVDGLEKVTELAARAAVLAEVADLVAQHHLAALACVSEETFEHVVDLGPVHQAIDLE